MPHDRDCLYSLLQARQYILNGRVSRETRQWINDGLHALVVLLQRPEAGMKEIIGKRNTLTRSGIGCRWHCLCNDWRTHRIAVIRRTGTGNNEKFGHAPIYRERITLADRRNPATYLRIRGGRGGVGEHSSTNSLAWA